MAVQPQAGHPSPAHVLVVDDDESITALLENILAPNYRVTVTHSGLEALQQLEHEYFDLVISDIDMPGVSGYDLLAAVREKPDYADVPFILLSAMRDSADVARGLELGANDYLTK